MKRKLKKKLTLSKQTVADLCTGDQRKIKAGAEETYATCLLPLCPGKTEDCTGITCQVETGCWLAPPTECASPTLSVAPWVCPCE